MPATRIVFGMMAAAGLFCTACKKKAVTAPEIPAPSAVNATLETAFKAAPPAVKQEAKDVETAIQANEMPKAFLQLNAMASNPNLSPEQRKVVLQSRTALNLELQKRAQQGDTQAAEVLEAYRASK